MDALHPLQSRLVEEYFVDYKLVPAGKRAGYTNPNAIYTAWKLPQVQAYVAVVQDELKQRTMITVDRIIHELSCIAFSNIQDYVTHTPHAFTGKTTATIDLTQLSRDESAAISSIEIGPKGEVKFKLYSKPDALVKLGQQVFNMFKPQMELSTAADAPAPVVNVTIAPPPIKDVTP